MWSRTGTTICGVPKVSLTWRPGSWNSIKRDQVRDSPAHDIPCSIYHDHKDGRGSCASDAIDVEFAGRYQKLWHVANNPGLGRCNLLLGQTECLEKKEENFKTCCCGFTYLYATELNLFIYVYSMFR